LLAASKTFSLPIMGVDKPAFILYHRGDQQQERVFSTNYTIKINGYYFKFIGSFKDKLLISEKIKI